MNPINRLDLTGQRHGRLTAVAYAGSRNGRTLWTFACDCGAVKVIQSRHVLDGGTKACGCIRKGIKLPGRAA